MKILIIEDEPLTAQDLSEVIKSLQPEAEIIGIIPSVKKALHFFANPPHIDLIFSDIQLEDGLSFEIYKSATIIPPIIFCTAFNEYAIQAFKSNGIDYLLKPFSSDHIASALKKYQSLKQNFSTHISQIDKLEELLGQFQSIPAVTSILVYYKDQIIPVKLSEVALFYIRNEMTWLVTLSGKNYQTDQTLEQLERKCGQQFFRVNRQYLINAASILETKQTFNRKLKLKLCVTTEEEILVSKNKGALYLEWLTRV